MWATMQLKGYKRNENLYAYRWLANDEIYNVVMFGAKHWQLYQRYLLDLLNYIHIRQV